ncbi:Hypothetical_protein [Hexamita inflata]|uniref:Hypothetical_protein n=1 Tax=Hexamita inflata TaxID=28002 RepID=A0AA86QSQ1_9EUKA|nr:Hypothetical protein HINF_LOCUS46194 [Hexamita inflata]
MINLKSNKEYRSIIDEPSIQSPALSILNKSQLDVDFSFQKQKVLNMKKKLLFDETTDNPAELKQIIQKQKQEIQNLKLKITIMEAEAKEQARNYTQVLEEIQYSNNNTKNNNKKDLSEHIRRIKQQHNTDQPSALESQLSQLILVNESLQHENNSLREQSLIQNSISENLSPNSSLSKTGLRNLASKLGQSKLKNKSIVFD